MNKSKKQKRPNIPPSALARPRLDALLDQTHDDPEQVANQIVALMRELGSAPVLDSFVICVETAPESEQDRLHALASHLRTEGSVTYLWGLVKR